MRVFNIFLETCVCFSESVLGFCVALGWFDHGLMHGWGWRKWGLFEKTKASEVSIYSRFPARLRLVALSCERGGSCSLEVGNPDGEEKIHI
jgi:hypothetical protein